MLTIAFSNQKGGVGKSTTVFHLAREAAKRSLRTLVIDADPQGNISSAIAAFALNESQISLADALSTRTQTTLDEVIIPTIWESVFLVPTVGDTLASVRDELVIAGAGRESRLMNELAPLQDLFDLCLIDCPPSLDQLTINALTAADGAAIVTQSKQWSINGLAHLLQTIESVRRYYNPRLAIHGIIVNLHDTNTLAASHWLNDLESAAADKGLKLFTPPVPKRVILADTVEASLGLDQWPTISTHELQKIYAKYLALLIEGTS